MENFNAKEYRNNLAKDLKEIRKTDPEKAQEMLIENQETEQYKQARKDREENKLKLEDKKLSEYLQNIEDKGIKYKIMALDDIRSNIKDLLCLRTPHKENGFYEFEEPFLDIKIQDGKIFVLREIYCVSDQKEGFFPQYISSKAQSYYNKKGKVVVTMFDGDMNELETTKPYIFKEYTSNPYKSWDDKVNMSKPKPESIKDIENGKVTLDTGVVLDNNNKMDDINFTYVVLDKENKSLTTEKINEINKALSSIGTKVTVREDLEGRGFSKIELEEEDLEYLETRDKAMEKLSELSKIDGYRLRNSSTTEQFPWGKIRSKVIDTVTVGHKPSTDYAPYYSSEELKNIVDKMDELGYSPLTFSEVVAYVIKTGGKNSFMVPIENFENIALVYTPSVMSHTREFSAQTNKTNWALNFAKKN
ncbi:MAG: hypothetical protein U0469_00105 [Candidatus Paceibacterota bacterium]|jgi:hypothetical protein